MKPWGKIELDYINHDKFRALTPNAICLWHEGKNYCDIRHTDGLIPTTTAKLFRFYGTKSMTLLTTSCGIKPGTDRAYFPLWERVDGFGFKMHDYLEHNDSRDVVLARIDKADEERDRRSKNQQTYRDRKKAERVIEETVTPPITLVITQDQRLPALPDKQKQQQQQNQKEEQKGGGGSKRPIYQSDRFVVFEWMLDDLGRMLGAHLDAFDLHQFFDSLSKQSRDQGLVIPKLQVWPWLQAQVLGEAKRRGLPIINGVTQSTRVSGCRHTDPPCLDEATHTSRYLREQAAS